MRGSFFFEIALSILSREEQIMVSYIVRRILLMIPVLFLISIVSFVLIQLPPGDFLSTYMARLQMQELVVSEGTIERLTQQYGLDQPVYVQYFVWIGNMFRGDFGDSFLYARPIGELIGNRIGMTILLGIATIAFTWLVGVPIGIYSATHKYRLSDHLWTFVGFIGLSTPNFVLALAMMYFSFVWFDFIPAGLFSPEYADAAFSIGKLLDFFAHLWLPVVILGTAGTAGIIRVMRGNLLDVLGEDYIQTARAKGVRESVVIYRHAVRNAIHPLIMSLGEVLKNVISGATVVAIVLSLPTVGPLLFEALLSQDMYLAGTLIMFQSFFLVVGYLLADLLLAAVDPRITYT